MKESISVCEILKQFPLGQKSSAEINSGLEEKFANNQTQKKNVRKTKIGLIKG